MSKVVKIDRNRRRKNKKKNKGSLLILIVIIVSLVLGLLIMISLLKIKTIEIEGNTYYSNQQILVIAGIDETTSILKLRIDGHIDLEPYPYVEEVKINYTGFDSIQIQVKEKEIVGYIPYGTAGYLSIDREGYVIDFASQVPDDAILIKGIIINNFILGEKIAVDDTLTQAFLLFSQAKRQYELDIREINFNEGDLNDVIFYIDDLKVEFGNMDQFNVKMQKIKDAKQYIFSQEKRIFDVEHNTLK